MDYRILNWSSWVMKSILKSRCGVEKVSCGDRVMKEAKFPTVNIYIDLRRQKEVVQCRNIFYSNQARPRALFILWMICHERVNIKEGWDHLVLLQEGEWCFCQKEEGIDHMCFWMWLGCGRKYWDGCRYNISQWFGMHNGVCKREHNS